MHQEGLNGETLDKSSRFNGEKEPNRTEENPRALNRRSDPLPRGLPTPPAPPALIHEIDVQIGGNPRNRHTAAFPGVCTDLALEEDARPR